MTWKRDDTIAAIATPPGVGGIGVIRVSGPAAVEIVARCFRPDRGPPLGRGGSHRLRHGWIERDGEPLDEVLAVWMRAPGSYTGEDVVEVHGHGGTAVLRAVLEQITAGGARLAEPGEFTLRAFLNGRIDLTRVEAVADLVGARSDIGVRVSAHQLKGRLFAAIDELKEQVAHVAALVAAGIDFPEEDVVFSHRDDILARLTGTRERLAALVAGAERGRILREGLGVAIVGRPNVGKSSLLNALLRENRAIVTEVPGTTRDTLEEAVEIDGLVLRLVDTAGLRDTADRVEREGILRTRAAIEAAELVLLVLDGAEPLGPEDRRLLGEVAPARSLAVVNKGDRLPPGGPPWLDELGERPRVVLSALTGAGMAEMERWIRTWAVQEDRPTLEEAMITNLRQKQAAQGALAAVDDALRAIDAALGDELLAVDLGRALDALGDIVGETTADDLLNRVFAEFCIGK